MAALLTGALLAGCDRPAEVGSASPPAATASASATTAAPRRSPSAANSTAPTPSRTSLPVFSELTAEPCRGYPAAEQVIALLRTIGLLSASGTVTVVTGPMCAGSWQYTVLQTSGRDPLQVVTKGPAYALTLVTAGTDVCTIDVRTLAPPGIRAVTRC